MRLGSRHPRHPRPGPPHRPVGSGTARRAGHGAPGARPHAGHRGRPRGHATPDRRPADRRGVGRGRRRRRLLGVGHAAAAHRSDERRRHLRRHRPLPGVHLPRRASRAGAGHAAHPRCFARARRPGHGGIGSASQPSRRVALHGHRAGHAVRRAGRRPGRQSPVEGGLERRGTPHARGLDGRDGHPPGPSRLRARRRGVRPQPAALPEPHGRMERVGRPHAAAPARGGRPPHAGWIWPRPRRPDG